MAAKDSPTPSEWRDIRACLIAAGVQRAKFKRVHDGEAEWHELS